MTWQDLIGTQLAGRYTLRTLLDAGSHQSEFSGTASDESEGAVSIALVEPEPGEAGEELAAITRARRLRHPNLLQILDAGECLIEGVPMLFIVTEGAEGTLAATLAGGPLRAPAALLEDLVAALEWLHAQGLVYRNLTPETIVGAGGRWKLADLSQLHTAGEFGRSYAAGRAVPPEAAAGSILPAWDIWAVGALLQDVVAGEDGVLLPPFDAIARGCLEPDPGRRLSLPAIRKLLNPEPEPAYVPEGEPVTESQDEEPARSHSRTWIAILIAVVILGALGFAFLRRGHDTGPVPAPPPVTHPVPVPAPAAAPPPAPVATPPPAKPAPVAPAQHIGRADYASDDLEGQLTASGERFSNHAMTASSREFPIGTRLRVTDLQNGRHVTVRVNDRGPHRRGFIISLTRRAAEQLGFIKAGSARVKIEAIK